MTGKLHWSGYVYYYLAAFVGLGFVLAGVVGLYTGVVDAAFPRSYHDFDYHVREELGLETYSEEQGPPPSPGPQEVARAEAKVERRFRDENGQVL